MRTGRREHHGPRHTGCRGAGAVPGPCRPRRWPVQDREHHVPGPAGHWPGTSDRGSPSTHHPPSRPTSIVGHLVADVAQPTARPSRRSSAIPRVRRSVHRPGPRPARRAPAWRSRGRQWASSSRWWASWSRWLECSTSSWWSSAAACCGRTCRPRSSPCCPAVPFVVALGDCERTVPPLGAHRAPPGRCLWTLKPAVVGALSAWAAVSPTTVGTGITRRRLGDHQGDRLSPASLGCWRPGSG